MAEKHAEVSLETQLEEAERKGREEGMAYLFSAFSSAAANADAGEQQMLNHQERDIESQFRGHTGTTMVYAAGKNHTELVLFSLKAGVDVDSYSVCGHTALQYAAFGRHIELVQTLLEAGADPNLKNQQDNLTPLACAAQVGHIAIAEILLAAGANVNKQWEGSWPISYFARGNHVEMTQLLLKAGAYIGPHKDDDWTPLMSAARNGKAKAAALLIEAGSDVNAQDCFRGISVLMTAVEADKKGILDTIRLLLKSGAEIDKKDKEGRTALLHAAEAGRSEAVRLLLSAGADVFSRAKAREARMFTTARQAGHAFDLATDDAVKEILKSEMHRRIAAALSVLPMMAVDVRQQIIQLYTEEGFVNENYTQKCKTPLFRSLVSLGGPFSLSNYFPLMNILPLLTEAQSLY